MANEDGVRLFWVQLAMLIPCLVLTGLRIYVRAFMARAFSADDWIIVLAMAIFLASSSITMRGATAGALGKENGHASTESLVASMRGIYLCEVLYPPVSLAVRVSVCLFLLRIVNKRVHKKMIYVLLAIVSTASVGYFLTAIFQCIPTSYFWNQVGSDVKGYCIDEQTLTMVAFVHGSISALSAWVVGLLPVVILWNVRMNRRAKITIVTLLGMSILAGITLIVRMTTLRSHKLLSKDYFRATMNTALWSMIEPGVGIIAASLPTLRPLFNGSSPSSSRANNIALSGHGAADHRSRVLELKPDWLELTTRDAHDEELGRPDAHVNRKTSASATAKEASVCNTCIERGDDLEIPPPIGISIHTAIEVTSELRGSTVS